jgi:hypothetical protein
MERGMLSRAEAGRLEQRTLKLSIGAVLAIAVTGDSRWA